MPCPDPDELALAASGSGDASQRQGVLDHAASCEECHAALMVLAPTAISEPASPTLSPPASAGGTVDRYRLGAELGRGAMGVVYAARDPELDREVAVKVLRPSASAARLKREAQALARLAHPNVVRVYDVGEHEGQSFVAMELVRGGNVRQWLRTKRTVDEILAVLRRAGEGLAAAHRAGLVHRDVKPDNVFISDDGGVLVGDFGLARSTDSAADASDEAPDGAAATMPMSKAQEQLTATGAIVGTPAYMAPEQNEGEATAASDQYAFCVMAWEALYGTRPIIGATLAELRERARAGTITPPPERSDIPARIERALRRGLSPSPESRFPSMDALLAELAPPPTRRRWVVPAVALAAVAASGAVFVVARGGSNRSAACETAANAIAPDWTPDIATRVRERLGDGAKSALATWVDHWRERRAELCRTANADDARVACLERARVSFRQTVAGVVAASSSLQPDAIARVLPSLDRCDVASGATTAPPPAIADRIAALDEKIAAVELGAYNNVPQATREQVAALAAEAKQLGFAPQLLRVQLLDGLVSRHLGDEAAAIATFRAVMVAAETQADDLMRARAGAHLAVVLARRRDDETNAVITSARAALARAGQDASTEMLLLEAEAAYAMGRREYAAAAAAQERIIALTIANFGPDAPGLGDAYAAASGAFALAGDVAHAQARSHDMTAWAERALHAKGAPAEAAAILAEDTHAPFLSGDFATVRAISLRQIAYLRSMPIQEPYYTAQTMATLARACELDLDCNEALRWYAEAEAILRRPLAEIAGTGAPDPTGVASTRIDMMIGQGSCLLDFDRADEAVAILRAAEAEAVAGGASTANDMPFVKRLLGQALSAAGQHREAIAILSPIVDGFPATAPRPFMRGLTAFALAQSLWATGGEHDRERALALANDAERELKAAIADAADPAQPTGRKLGAKAKKKLDALAAWRAAHPAR
jgi:predicted Ser/Thr protein kinase